MMLKWDSSFLENIDRAQQLDHVRAVRDRELAATDWTQLPDAPCDRAAWAEYRQALRDLPTQDSDPKKIVFPARPK